MSQESNRGFISDVMVVAALLADLWLTARRDDESATPGKTVRSGRDSGEEEV